MFITEAGITKPSYRIGIDIGGTSVKCGLLDFDNNIVAQKAVPTNSPRPWQDLLKDIGNCVREMLAEKGLTLADCEKVGVGCPGTVDGERGFVPYSNNLVWKDVPVADALKEDLGLDVKVSNDANCAALGEVVAGAAKGCANAVMLTLGTGVGSGIVINGKIFEGGYAGGAELGHIMLEKDGLLCSCGRKGCIEAYASATALERDAKEAITIFKDSLMAKTDNLESKVVFDAVREGDFAAIGIVYNYILALGEGLADIINIFRPEKIIIGGGISRANDLILEPLSEVAKKNCFGGNESFTPVFVTATLGNDAGIIGAGNL